MGSHTDDEAATGGTILGSAHIDCQQVVEPPCAHVEEVENGASEQDEAQSRPQAAHQAAEQSVSLDQLQNETAFVKAYPFCSSTSATRGMVCIMPNWNQNKMSFSRLTTAQFCACGTNSARSSCW